MSTNSYSGSALDVKWIHSGGTATISGNQRTLSYTPSIDFIDQSSGADSSKKYLNGLKDGQATLEALVQAGTNSGGTAAFSTLTEGAVGTLVWSPEGTAATKPKYTIPAKSGGVGFTYPYSDVTVASVSFQQNGDRTEGTN